MRSHIHFLRWELGRLGPWLLIFLLSVAGCAWGSAGWHLSADTRETALPLFATILSAVLIVGSLFLNLGPRRPLDFWAGRPGDPTRRDVKVLIFFGLLLLPMIFGHLWIIGRLGFSPWTVAAAVVRGTVGLVLFFGWPVGLALITRSWTEFLVSLSLIHLPLAWLFALLLFEPTGFLATRLLVFLGLAPLLILSLRQRKRWRRGCAFLLLTMVGIAFFPMPDKAASPLGAEALEGLSTSPMRIELKPVDAVLGDRDPFLCVSLDDEALAPGFAYELELTGVSSSFRNSAFHGGGIYPMGSIWQKPVATDVKLLPQEARLSLSERMPLAEWRRTANADARFEVRGTLRRLAVLSPSAMPLRVGAETEGERGMVRIEEIETFNKELNLILRTPWLQSRGPWVSSSDRSQRLETPIWVGPNRRWAQPIDRRHNFRREEPVSLLAPFSGRVLRLQELKYQSPHGAVSRDIPGSELVLWPRRVLAETEVTLRSSPEHGIESFLCDDLD